MFRTEAECIDYIHSAGRFGKKAGLDNIKALLNYLGNPQKELRCIHIAGTNGKGSVSCMIASVLSSKGYKVGMNTSPYIEVFNERLTINGENIPSHKLIHYTNLVAEAIKAKNIHPIEFEIITAIGFAYFKDEKCDYAVIECGLGGLLDCTNVIENPVVTVITPIGKDHTEILGNTLEEIAFQKAGIIKEAVPVVIHPDMRAAAVSVIESCARKKASPFVITGKSKVLSSDIEGSLIECEGERFTLSLLGSYQPDNAALAVNVLKQLGITDVAQGMANARWKCRFERVKDRVIIDGAHNFHGIKAFCESVNSYVPSENRVILVGMLNDKDFEESAEAISKLESMVVVTDVPSYRQTDGISVYECIKKYCPQAVYEPDYIKATEMALNMTGNNGYLCVAGSLYLAGAIRTFIKNN